MQQPETSRNASTEIVMVLYGAENRRDTLQIDLPMLPVLLHQPCQAAAAVSGLPKIFSSSMPATYSENAASSSVEERFRSLHIF